MNQIYVILGAPLWQLLGKKIGLWYTHGTVSRSLRIAEKLTHKVFSASKDSFKIESKKLVVTGHGIDTNSFCVIDTPKTTDLITVGRISKAKNLFTLIDILKEVRQSTDAKLTIVGMSVTAEEKQYEASLRAYIGTHGLDTYVHFTGKAAQTELPVLLNQAKVFVTVANNGSLDKAFLEAAACALPIVSMASGSSALPLGSAQVYTQDDFISATNHILKSKDYINLGYNNHIKKEHSLQMLVPKIIQHYVK